MRGEGEGTSVLCFTVSYDLLMVKCVCVRTEVMFLKIKLLQIKVTTFSGLLIEQ